MQTDILNIGLAFIEGFALIISPCILPILPIILAGSLTGSKKRPFGIIFGFILIFALFTFFSRKLVQYSGIDTNFIRHISFVILLLLGIIMISTYLTEKFNLLTQRLVNTGSTFTSVNNPQGGFVSGILFGGLVAIIWTPCAGPILAAVIVQTVLQQTNFLSLLTLFAFGIGAAVPMLIIAMFGRKIMLKLNFFKTHAMLLRKTLGAVIIVSVISMIYFESSVPISFSATTHSQSSLSLQDGISSPYPAPPISGIAAWINSKPLQLSDLKGKVVLIDFWTYSCINCVRTLPYLKDWYQKYHDKGFIIIGVHAPEFEFEADLNNVKNAVSQKEIHYPVALDNNFVTWRNYNNSYWPAHYLIDKKGNVVYQHFGEGKYDITENNIRYLLGINNPISSTKQNESPQFSFSQTPETYLGYARVRNFANEEFIKKNEIARYTFSTELSQDSWSLQGAWKIMPDRIISAEANASLRIHFNARKVFIVMGNATPLPLHVKLLLNNKPVTNEKGKDVSNSNITVNKHELYEAVVLDQSGDGILQLTADLPGLEIYTFTFGE